MGEDGDSGMNITWIEGPSRPYVKDDALYLPHTQNDVRWSEITTKLTIAVIRMEWKDASELGWVAEWIFFNTEQEIPWDEVQDKVSVARSFREWNFHPDDVIPWGDDIETLIALEQS